MKCSLSVCALLAIQVVSCDTTSFNPAGATTHLEKRTSVNDVATIGYASLGSGTTGGSGGTSTTVTTLSALTAAVSGTAKKIVIISGTITGNTVVKVDNNTSVLGASGSSLVGVGLRVLNSTNVIIRNVKISKVLTEAGDAIGIQNSSQVWVDHVDLSSDRDHDKDYYDGLLDITHGSTGISVTWSKLYDHWKASLVGHSDANGDEDTKITVTYAYNYWYNLNSRTPVFRFGHGHIFCNVFDNNDDGINCRDSVQLLIEYNVWSGVSKAIYCTGDGYVVARGNDFGGGTNSAVVGNFSTPLYAYDPTVDLKALRTSVVANAGQTLSF